MSDSAYRGVNPADEILYNNYKVRCAICSVCHTKLGFVMDIYRFDHSGADIRRSALFDLSQLGVSKNLNHHLMTLRLSWVHHSMYGVQVPRLHDCRYSRDH